ncbi:MAG: flagellar hook-basal body complex protein, partial [Phycisphaerae bacterium]
AEATFTVGVDGTTVGDLAAWLDEVPGIQSGGTIPGTPGVTVVGGQIRIEGNYGEDNELAIGAGDILSSGAVSQPFSFDYDATATNAGHASGTSITTSFIVYDSLGTPVSVSLTMVLETKASTGNTWRFYVESPDDTDTDLAIGTGTITFDTDGQALSTTGTQMSIDRDDTGAADPLAFDLDLTAITSLTTESPNLVQTAQDGFAAGSLSAFSIAEDGLVIGTFTNGLTRTLGQVAVATFANPAGLAAQTNNTFLAGPNSGEPVITAPQTLGTGRILSGALELSNVDLSRQFIGLITASTGFSAGSRVVSTCDELLKELLLITR